MEFSLSWILLGLPLAFALGWLASRFDLRQIRLENRQAPKAYFRGLNYLLNEQQDQAIDAFIEAVQKDPDTSELHFALGNLFRRRGEYERAVRVHEHLMSRGDLSQADRHRAQHALALDFLKAGLLDRAEDALNKLEGTAFETEARLALLANYERSRDWVLAAQVAHKLENANQGSFHQRLAHYLCEQAADDLTHGRVDAARVHLEEAVNKAPDAARARLALSQLQANTGDLAGAQQTLFDAMTHAPTAIPLIAGPLADIALRLGNGKQALDRLQTLYEQHASLDVLDAIVRLSAGTAGAERDWYARHLAQEPSLVAATRWIAGEKFEDEQFHPQVQRALDHAIKPLLRYRCAACGFEATQHFWQCPGCQTWDSYPARRVEEL
ncbi:lipopolysaccharide assembly protein LapB [Rhodoferax sp. U11-2br]|uniref:lipopolysaccharide assembly protein LapB n=1 Tax=Rhodoferax sp. U11-2br TaxID=2838878 RepID=UPI001BE72EB4|nr:lipopolysaccharide assembly protein LapB [Rhodoferax sp. U11-2br]MBT3065695.1 lipopolysaccharide assembly protein LapB [Rhodoferax sp. U11-2br]